MALVLTTSMAATRPLPSACRGNRISTILIDRSSQMGFNKLNVGSVSNLAGFKVRSTVKNEGMGAESLPVRSVESLEADEASCSGNEVLPQLSESERDFGGTPYVPVYVMLPLDVVNMNSELVNPDDLSEELKILKSINVDGVMVDCWWGVVEANSPQKYNWSGYRRLFHMVQNLGLKLQVVMSFHECGGNVGDTVHIPLPKWVTEIGENNPDIYFTDREGRRNDECLSWGIDKERVLRGRTALENGTISEIEIGLGPCGELRYPSYPAKFDWRYPGIGEFQCYDKYLLKSLGEAAKIRGLVSWAMGPHNTGTYNSWPQQTSFFRDGGDYDSYYGRFFLNWYSQVLIDHGDRVLGLANLVFEGTHIAAKLSGIHWWYKTASHAAELTAGFYNPRNRDGYAKIAVMLKRHEFALNFTCVELRTSDVHMDFPEALADPEGLVWQVLNAAWDVNLSVASENALPCYHREGYNKILENAKPRNDPDGKHLSAFTYLRLNPNLMGHENFREFRRFVKRMHGKKLSRTHLLNELLSWKNSVIEKLHSRLHSLIGIM